MTTNLEHCTAFAGSDRLASGAPAQVALAVKAALARHRDRAILVFDDATGQQVDFDLRGTDAEILARLAPEAPLEAPRGPGRPPARGCRARGHAAAAAIGNGWASNPAARRSCCAGWWDAARTTQGLGDQVRLARQAADRFMVVLAGNLSGYEEASRALYAGDRARFEAETSAWPADIRDHARRLAQPGLERRWPSERLR